MLLEFRVQNYLSFCDEVVFSMLAANSVNEHDGSDNPADMNLIPFAGGKERVLKFAAVYGANGSGKSNLIRSIVDMRNAVLFSNVDDELMGILSHNFFKLDVDSQNQPSAFEVSFSIESCLYRYGFEFFNGSVTAEWLFRRPAGAARESYCFRREGEKIQTNNRTWKGANGIDAKTRANALYLSTCAQFNVSEAIKTKNWFRSGLLIISGIDNEPISFTATRFQQDPRIRSQMLDFMHQIDPSIRDISVNITDATADANLPSFVQNVVQKHIAEPANTKFQRINILMERDLYQNGHKIGTTKLPFNFESEGTKKAFIFSRPWFDTLNHGYTLIVDEFGSSLHTMLAVELVKVFQQASGTEAQLVVATHDTNLLRKDLLRRDQIWFTEKNPIGATDLYSLVEYRIDQARAVRNNASYGKDYLLGRYGAIPYFGDIEKFLGSFGDS